MEINIKVKQIRKQLKMSQTAFAKELNVDYTTLSRVERGIFKPSYRFIENLKNLCNKFNISFDKDVAHLEINQLNSNNILADISNIENSSHKLVNCIINYELIQRNWLIGKRINEKILSFTNKNYISKLIENLSLELTNKFGKGFTKRNLYYYVDFYNKFPNILHSVSAQSLLSWTHYRVLLQVEDKRARERYLNEAYKESWSVRTLQRNISSQYYNRIMASTSKNEVHEEMIALNELNQDSESKIIKDPSVLEFLGVPENNTYLETSLESTLIAHLNNFILNLDKGYAFIARQQRIHTEKEDYFIDLVFYNYILKCFVLVDIKTTKITHQDIGQMNMYIKMYDELNKDETDNPTLGIILTSETDEDIIKYSFINGSDQLFTSKYNLYIPSDNEIKQEIEIGKDLYFKKN